MEAMAETNRPMYAALKHEAAPEILPPRDITVEVRVNVHGQVMILHNQAFYNIPLWIKYRNAARRLEILFENGYTLPLENEINDGLNNYLVKAAKVTLVHVENNNVVEGWETILLNDLYQ